MTDANDLIPVPYEVLQEILEILLGESTKTGDEFSIAVLAACLGIGMAIKEHNAKCDSEVTSD